MKGGRVLQRAGQRDLGPGMFVYHRLGDIVFRLGMRATVLACHPVVLPPLLRPDAATLLSLQRHLVRVNGFPVGEGVETLPSPRGGLVQPSADHIRDVVATTRGVVGPLATLQRLQRVLVTTAKRNRQLPVGNKIKKRNFLLSFAFVDRLSSIRIKFPR